MEIHETEEQQVEAIKKWWSENMWSVVGGIAIGIGALVGGRAWVDGQNTYMEVASSEYQHMLENVTIGNNDVVSEQGGKLLGQYADTPYAALAALAMAKVKTDSGDIVAATSHLRWAIDNSDQEPVKHEARLRLSRLLLADNKKSEALTVLDVVDMGAYASAYEQLKGDVYVADGKPESARTSYSRALETSLPGTAGHQTLQMKLDDLGATEMGIAEGIS